MKYRLLILIIANWLFVTSIDAQQWVLDELADEQNSSEHTPAWIVILFVIIGYMIYRYLAKKDAEDEEKREKERKIEERNRLREELEEYRKEHEDDEDPFMDGCIIESVKPQMRPSVVRPSRTNANRTVSSVNVPAKEAPKTAPKSVLESDTEFYTLSADGKELIKAKDADEIVVPEGVEKIHFNAFGRKNKSVTLPRSLKVIDELAFMGCSIEKIVVPSSVERFGDSIFSGCESLKEVVIEDGIKTLGIAMFERCLNLGKVSLPNTLNYIPDSAFECCISLNNIKLPDSLKRIGDCAFYCCQSLEAIEIPKTVTEIGYAAFRQCYALSKITIPDGVYGISEHMFYDDYDLKEVILPPTITCIMSNAFYGCEHLHIVIPPSVTYIAPDAFQQCNELSYGDLHIEVPFGKKEKLEKICEALKGQITEYKVEESFKITPYLQQKKKEFINLHNYKEKKSFEDSELSSFSSEYVNKTYDDNFS